MEENTQEKSLIEKSEKSLFGKIKDFFKNLFSKKKKEIVNETNASIEENNNDFKENIKISEDEEQRLLDLQKKYHHGAIAENDLTDEQIDALCLLYDKQIEEIKKTIKMKEEQIQEYKKTRKQKIEKNNT